MMIKNSKISVTVALFSILLLSACSGINASAPARALNAVMSTAVTSQLAAPTYTPVAPAVSQPKTSTKNGTVQSTKLNVSQQATLPATSLAAYQQTLEQIYQKVNPSVVNIDVVEAATTIVPRRFGGSGVPVQQTALGSGFVWDTQGHIVTNNHVIDGASKISVTFADGTTAAAKVVGADLNSDLAVIQVNVPASQLQPVELADSSQVMVGQVAIAIGNPYGFSGSMTVGIISGLDRSLPVGLDNPNSQNAPTYSIPDIIQTDASINPGNSGGVLVNDQGQVMGVTAAIESSTNSNSGIGFVIPSNIVKKVAPALIQTGHYDHPQLGISGTPLTPDLNTANHLSENQQGILVVDVTPDGPAAKAGLKGSSQQIASDGSTIPVGGDVILAIDQTPVTRFEDIASYLFNNTQAGQVVTLDVLRNGQHKSFNVTLGTLPQQ
jgi:serine protease Do